MVDFYDKINGSKINFFVEICSTFCNIFLGNEN